ncbi:MAG: FliA/WhiG family RNA polymerase sigma factor [Planctomycetaceae bacterium]|nr:FliA/WhiG family RNA polymerase sigma factor [Planctomycetaceae bacterium]
MQTEREQLDPAPVRGVQEKAAQAYRAHVRQSQEEKLILENLPLVQHIVRKFATYARKALDRDDLISAGTLGLVKAARTFNPDKHVEFRTYAYILIRGAIVDEMRRNSFVPSPVAQQLRAVEEAYNRLTGQRGRPPDDEELAAAMGIPAEQLYRTLTEARQQHFLSLHGLTDEQPLLAPLAPADDSPSPQSQAAHREMVERLAESVKQLSQRDRHILVLYYDQELTMKEIALVLNVTESRVSQLHASAIFKLSMKLRSRS